MWKLLIQEKDAGRGFHELVGRRSHFGKCGLRLNAGSNHRGGTVCWRHHRVLGADDSPRLNSPLGFGSPGCRLRRDVARKWLCNGVALDRTREARRRGAAFVAARTLLLSFDRIALEKKEP